MNNRLYLALPLLVLSLNSFAEATWQNTILSEETIKKIQQAGYEYKKCASDEMLKIVYKTQDSRNATNEIIKLCEPILTKMREVYVTEKVPEVIIDRHLKQMRTNLTRNVLQEMMYSQAMNSTTPKP